MKLNPYLRLPWRALWLLGLILAFGSTLEGLDEAQASTPSPGRDYRLSSNDLVAITVYRHEDLGANQRIDASGRVRIPLLGPIDIAGLSLRDAERVIREAFREERILVDPQVSVRIQEYSIKQVSVLGEVENPGPVAFAIEKHRMDLREVIAQAGGFTSVAKEGDIQIFRRTETGDEEVIEVDFDDLVSSRRDRGEGFFVYDGDVIFVPDRIF
jgi:polysaccharide export outer membrane protein